MAYQQGMQKVQTCVLVVQKNCKQNKKFCNRAHKRMNQAHTYPHTQFVEHFNSSSVGTSFTSCFKLEALYHVFATFLFYVPRQYIETYDQK